MKKLLLSLVSLSLVISSQTGALAKGNEEVSRLGLNVSDNPSSQKAKNSLPKLGLNVSSCSEGNPPLRMTKNFKPKPVRDVYRRIAENFDAIGPAPERQIDQEKLNEKLKSLVGEKPLTCQLTLKPSGRFEAAKILESSGNITADKRFISLLKNIGSFGASENSKNQLSYRLQLPNLKVAEVQP